MTSTETPPSAAPAPRQGLSLVQKVVYIAVAVVFGLIGLAKLITWNDLPGCDSTKAKNTLSDIFKQRKVEATRYDSIDTVSKKDDEILCNAKLSLKDGGKVAIDYKLFKENNETRLLITEAKDL
jgi:hypothetical protein